MCARQPAARRPHDHPHNASPHTFRAPNCSMRVPVRYGSTLAVAATARRCTARAGACNTRASAVTPSSAANWACVAALRERLRSKAATAQVICGHTKCMGACVHTPQSQFRVLCWLCSSLLTVIQPCNHSVLRRCCRAAPRSSPPSLRRQRRAGWHRHCAGPSSRLPPSQHRYRCLHQTPRGEARAAQCCPTAAATPRLRQQRRPERLRWVRRQFVRR